MEQRSTNFVQAPLSGPTIQSLQPPVSTQAVSGYIQEGFENVIFPPAGWQVRNVNGPTYTWARSTAQAHLSTASAFIRYDAVAGGGLDWLIAPHYTVTAATDSVVFWMRLAFAGYQPDSLAIKVSTTDSLLTSFTTTLLLLREGTNYPPNNTTWYRYAVSLQNYVGQNIYVAFKHYNVDGDGLYIDDVSMGTRPANEVSTTAMISPTTTVAPGAVTPQGTFFNAGTAAQTFNVTTTINPGGYTSTTSVSLASGASSNASFTVWNATAGTYTVKMFTELPGDANVLNDTITRTVFVPVGFEQYGWSNSTAIPAGRWATAPVFVNPCNSLTDTGFIYLISGADAAFANTTLNTRYNVTTGVYTARAPIPQSRTQVTPLHVNGKIYVIGGYGGSFSPVTTNSIYDIATDSWTTGATIPTAVGDYAASVYNDSLIYIVGGYTGSGDVNTVQIYDTYLNTWTTGTPKTGTAVAGCRMGIVGNQIVFVGGYSQTLAATQSQAQLGVINVATPTTITWSTLPNYPAGTTGRHGAGVSLENNGLVYFAGGDPNGQGTTTINAVYAYNTILSQWEIGPQMLQGVSNISGLAGAVRNDSLFIVTMGGYNGTAVTSNNAWLNIGAAMAPYAQVSAAVCAGNSVMIHGYDALSYSWTPAATLSNPNVDMPMASPLATTTYTVSMGVGYGCPIVDSTVVTVNALPTVTANTTSPAICAGDNVTLSGGGAATYVWTGVVTDNVPFTPASTDSYTVTGTDVNGCTNTASVTVTVNALPTVTASSTASTVCSGDAVTVNGGGASSYVWTGGVMDNVAFNPTATDTYTVTGTDANGCSNTANVTVTVNNLPTVTANTSAAAVCDGSPVTLSGGGATSYTWTGLVTDNVAFTPVATDTYTVTGTDANGCSNTASVSVTVNALPTVTVTLPMDTACQTAGIITLGGESPAGGTWSGPGVTGSNFDPTTSGLGTIGIDYTYVDANGCSAMATDSIWVGLCTDIVNAANNNGVAVYPNPNNGQFNLVLGGMPSAPVQVEIMNELGQVVNTFTMTGTQLEVNMNAFESGVYFVRITNVDVVNVTRFVKQ